MIVHPEQEEVDLNEARTLQDMYMADALDNTLEDVEPNTNTININMLDSLGLAPETVAKVNGYKEIVTGKWWHKTYETKFIYTQFFLYITPSTHQNLLLLLLFKRDF